MLSSIVIGPLGPGRPTLLCAGPSHVSTCRAQLSPPPALVIVQNAGQAELSWLLRGSLGVGTPAWSPLGTHTHTGTCGASRRGAPNRSHPGISGTKQQTLVEILLRGCSVPSPLFHPHLKVGVLGPQAVPGPQRRFLPGSGRPPTCARLIPCR